MRQTVTTASHACRMVWPTQATKLDGTHPHRDRRDDRGEENGCSRCQRLERPDGCIGFVVVQRDRDRLVEAGPWDRLLADGGDVECRPKDDDHRHDEPRQPSLPRPDFGTCGALCARHIDGELRVRRRLPCLEEQEGHDQGAERRQNVGQGVIDEVRRNELEDRERASGCQQGRPDGADGTHAAIDGHDIEWQDKRDDRQLASDHRAEHRRGQTGHCAEHRHRHAEGAESDRRRIEDQNEDQRLQSRKSDHDQEGRGDRHGSSKSGDALEQGAKTESDHDEDDAPVVRQMIEDPGAEGVKPLRTRPRHCRAGAH